MATEDIILPDFDELAASLADPDHDAATVKDMLIEVANWADLLIAPRFEPIEHHHDSYDINNKAGMTSTPGPVEGAPGQEVKDENRPPNLPMPGLTFDHFFWAPRALRGMNFELIAAADGPYETLRFDFGDLEEHVNPTEGDSSAASFTGAMHDLFDPAVWSGEAQQACAHYFDQLQSYLDKDRESVGALAMYLTDYATIMRGARRNFVDLMTTFTQTMRSIEVQSARAEQAYRLGMLSACLTLVLGVAGVATGGAIAATAGGLFKAVQPFLSLTATAGVQAATYRAAETNIGADYAAVGAGFLDQARQLIENTRTAIKDNVTGSIDDLRQHLPAPPQRKQGDGTQLPTTKDYDSDPSILVPHTKQ